MKLRAFLIACFLLIAPMLQAQTPTFKLGWDQPEALATVQTFQYTLKIDTGTAIALAPSCTVKGTGTTCTAPLPVMTSGQHTLVLTAFNGFGQASGSLAGGPPSTPINISVTVTITIP